MSKLLIRNQYSNSGISNPVVRTSKGGGERLTKPDGEVRTMAELVAMVSRGEDYSMYVRGGAYATEGDMSDDQLHDSMDMRIGDDIDVAGFAMQQRDLTNQLQMELDDFTASEKKLVDDAAAAKAAADAEELEKHREVSRSKKYSKKNTDSNDD